LSCLRRREHVFGGDVLVNPRRGAVLSVAHHVLSHAARDVLLGEDRGVVMAQFVP
jgi:hypothetical protein